MGLTGEHLRVGTSPAHSTPRRQFLFNATSSLGGVSHVSTQPRISYLDPRDTALVITDPQNDFLSPEGATWGVVGENVTANRTVENIDELFKAAKAADLPVFISPHYYYPHDHGWRFEGALEKLMHDIQMFDRKGALDLDGFRGIGTRLARTLQALHQRRRDRRRQPAQGLRSRNQ